MASNVKMGEKLIATLPLLQDAQFIVIDEDKHALNADNLLDGWMQMWSSTNTSQLIHLLLFFSTKSYYSYISDMFKLDNLRVYDFCTEDLDKIYDKREIDLNYIMNSIGDEKSIVIINCLSSLIVNVGLGKAVRLVETLSHRVGQLVCIYRRDFGREKVASIDTLGTTYVKLGKSQETVLIGEIAYEVSVVHRKRGGGILKKDGIITQDLITNEIKCEKVVEKVTVSTIATYGEPTAKPEASFRIDMNARELEQRNQTPLPYIIKPEEPVKESQIYYVPDANDDIDEEDPDDDLPF